MRCISCGSKNEEAVKFCKKCGKPIGEQKENEATDQTQKNEAPATVAPVVEVPTAVVKDRAEQPAFVLGICVTVLTVIPIPVISWFALPAALIGFILAASMWLKAKNEHVVISNRGLAAIVLNGFVVVNHLFTVIGLQAGTAGAIGDLANGIFSGLSGLI